MMATIADTTATATLATSIRAAPLTCAPTRSGLGQRDATGWTSRNSPGSRVTEILRGCCVTERPMGRAVCRALLSSPPGRVPWPSSTAEGARWQEDVRGDRHDEILAHWTLRG